jgi:tripartite-type tricarboxylate transporter receptor subunit TctC
MRVNKANYFNITIALLMTLFCTAAIPQVVYPSQPVKIVVGYAAGGGTDSIAKIMADKFAVSMHKPVYVENILGAGGNLGSLAVARAAPDGYTLLLGTMGNMVINPIVYKNIPIDTLKEFQPISNIATIPIIMAVNPDIPVNTVKEFVEWAKIRAGNVSYASSGRGTAPYIAGELFNQAAGLDMVHVSYDGSNPALKDLIAGQNVDVMFVNLPSATKFVRSAKLKALAVASAHRIASEPNLPTIKESGYPDFVVETWFGLFAPARTPMPIVNKLNAEILAALKNPDIQNRLKDLGAQPSWTSPKDYQKLLESDYKKWAEVVNKAKIEAQ